MENNGYVIIFIAVDCWGSTKPHRELSSFFMSAEGSSWDMNYRDMIIRMLEDIHSEKTLKAIYNLIMMYYRR